MANCKSLIAANIEAACNLGMGLEPMGYIINREDLASVTRSTTNENIVTAIALKSQKYAFTIYTPTKTPFNGTNVEMAEGDIQNDFTNTVAFVVLENSPAASKSVINPLANGEFVVIYANKYKNAAADNKWQIAGLEKGLKATAITHDPNDETNKAAYAVTLQETHATSAAVFFFDTDEETTDEALEALLPAA